MKTILQDILRLTLSETPASETPITGLGVFNRVFAVRGERGNYIVRMNNAPGTADEYAKETCCLGAVAELGVPSPSVLATGRTMGWEYMVHGDLCPRNALYHGSTTYLLDWGTAEVNVVPHYEIGLVLLEGEATPAYFRAFCAGLGVSANALAEMRQDIQRLTLLHQLDKYRWAETFDVDELPEYRTRVLRAAFIG